MAKRVDRLLVSKRSGCGEFCLVAESMVLGEVDRVDASVDCGEEAAGLDLGQLFRVADQDCFATGSIDLVDEASTLPGADDSGFVDEEDRVRRELGTARVEVGRPRRLRYRF